MENLLKILLDCIWRLTIIGLPVLGYHIETNSDSSLVFGLCCFFSAALIGVYGSHYDKFIKPTDNEQK